VVERVIARVYDGMGFVALHSAHRSKVFRTLMGTTCRLKWRVAAERERVWVVEPGHPIAAGLPDNFVVPHSEMYGERHNIPAPDAIVFLSWFEGGEVFRSGCCFHRGAGKIFFFSPGHEEYPIYDQPEVQQVLANAALWAAPAHGPVFVFGEQREPLERIGG
jgi:trehalose utilization protein